jgi:hypothetical protein
MDWVFVLTLDDARDRQERLLSWGAPSGLDCGSFISGVDLRGGPASFQAPVEGEQSRVRRYGKSQLAAAEYGCLLGHRQIWSLLLERDLDWGLVLEDDARPLRSDWSAAIEDLTTLLRASRLRFLPWVVHLAIEPHSRRTLALRPLTWRGPIPAGCPVLGAVDPRLGCLWTTTAYLISSQAAQLLLADEGTLPFAADDWDQRLRRGTVAPLLAARDPLFEADTGLESQIPCHNAPIPEAVNRIQRKFLSLVYRSGLLAQRY